MGEIAIHIKEKTQFEKKTLYRHTDGKKDQHLKGEVRQSFEKSEKAHAR